MAFWLSLILGGVVAVGLATGTSAQEEYIIVFMACGLVAIVVTILFFIAQFLPSPLKAINWVGLCTIVLIALMAVGLTGWTFSQPPQGRDWDGNLSIIAGLALPNLVAIAAQWLFVRWRVGPGLIGARTNR
jgi:hypothetical protein